MGDEKDRRNGKWSSTGDIISGKQGRKVFIGVWVFIMANAWYGIGLYLSRGGTFVGLTEKAYLILSLASVLLIGFGTITDTLVASLGEKVVDVIGLIVGSRVGTLASKIEKKVEEKTSVETTVSREPAQ